jgi:hypothetical protein
VYRTYASQIIQAEVREYLSKLSISEIASSNEKINSDLRYNLARPLKRYTFLCSLCCITNLRYQRSQMLRSPLLNDAKRSKRRSAAGDLQGAVRARIAGSSSATCD